MNINAQIKETSPPRDARILEGSHVDGDAGGGHVLREEVVEGEGIDAADGADDEGVGEGDGGCEGGDVMGGEVGGGWVEGAGDEGYLGFGGVHGQVRG